MRERQFVADMVKDTYVPKMFRVKQTFPRPKIEPEEIPGIIENLLNQAIEFLNKDLETSQALSNMLVTFILQLLATLVLFLVIRFKFWNVITAMIEKRETKIADSLKEKDEALKELEIAKKEAEFVKVESKKTANLIIEDAKKVSQIEADEILNEARYQIQREKENARDLIDKERKSMQENIKNEVVDIAFLMAEKIVEHEIDKKANQELINQTLSKLEKKD